MNQYEMPFQGMQSMTPMMSQQPMMSQPMMPQQHTFPHKHFVDQVNNCSAQCFHMMSSLTNKPYANTRDNQIKLLHDCARICASQVIYTVVGSQFDRQHARFCAEICEICGNECLRHPDFESQNCGRICLECANACRRHAGMM